MITGRSYAALAWLFAIVVAAAPGAASDAPKARPERVSPEQSRMPALRPAVLDDTLAIGGTEIDGKKVSSRMTVQVGVNGTGPYKFVVDSGADTSVVGERIAAGLELPPGRRVILNSITDSQWVDRVLVDELRLGPTTISGLEVPVLRERDLGAQGMLGLDALVEQRLMLDFEKRIITVDDGRTPLPPRAYGEIVVTAQLRKGQLILTEVSADRERLEAVVDTGSEITIGNTALRDRLLRRNAKFQPVTVTGVTGTEMTLQIATIDRLRIGRVMLANVPIAFADVPPFRVFGMHDRPALLLGTDLMENFRKVSLDFHSRKVRFQLRKCGADGVLLRTSSGSASRIYTDAPTACER